MSKEDKREVKLNHTRMKEAGYVRTLWVVTVEQGVTRDDMMKPEFWSHVSMQFSPYDRIEARCDDGTFFAEYLVLACERTYAKLKELSFVGLTSKDVAMTQAEQEEYEYKHRGPHRGHSIIRKSDGEVMTEQQESKQAALAWLKNYKDTIA